MTTQEQTVSAFDPADAPPETRLAVGRLLSACHAFAVPDDPPFLPERAAVNLTHVTPDEAAAHFVIWAGEEALGWGSLEYSLTA